LIFENQYIQERIKKAERLREEGINPYPANIIKGMPSSEFFEHFSYVKEQDAEEKKDETQTATLTGRIKFIRIMGKAAFAKIEDNDGLVQIYYNRDHLPEGYYNNVAKKLFEVGDIIEASGFPFVTQTGELTLHCKDIKIVSKAIMPLPEKFHGLTDHEIRYRQRYLDMIMNPEVKETFVMRSRIVSLIRRFFEDHGFLEVETPMMHPIPGGANAKPFVTHDQTHNPEFTSIEFYWAYHNYHDLMKLSEDLFDYIFAQLQLEKSIIYGEYEINFTTPFAKVPFVEALTTIGGVPTDVATDKKKAIIYLKEHGVEVNPNLTLGYLQAELFDEFVEGKLINPTFITDYPIDISPLSRRSDDNPDIAERFELFMAGKEIANGFNELNDPLDQFERFKAQSDAKEATGDEEAMHMDLDFVRALGHGMTPTAGEGIGIDRLVMMLTNNHSIRDVILFPAMKPEAALEEKPKNACKKCGNTNEEELKPAKKGKGFFCIDAAACKQRENSQKA